MNAWVPPYPFRGQLEHWQDSARTRKQKESSSGLAPFISNVLSKDSAGSLCACQPQKCQLDHSHRHSFLRGTERTRVKVSCDRRLSEGICQAAHIASMYCMEVLNPIINNLPSSAAAVSISAPSTLPAWSHDVMKIRCMPLMWEPRRRPLTCGSEIKIKLIAWWHRRVDLMLSCTGGNLYTLLPFYWDANAVMKSIANVMLTLATALETKSFWPKISAVVSLTVLNKFGWLYVCFAHY